MDEVAVLNASPLILLSRAGHLDLLKGIARRFVIPRPVAEEIMRRGSDDVTRRAMAGCSWLEIAAVGEIPAAIGRWGLGPGEESVLALAQAATGAVAVIDDLAARKCAVALGIPVRGTLGIVLLAKRRGIIPAARSVMEDLLRGGLYLSRNVLDEALRRVGE